MAQSAHASDTPLRARPQANVYTVLLVVAILALAATIGLVLYNLLAPLPDGYGLEIGALFEAPQTPTPSKLPPTPPPRVP